MIPLIPALILALISFLCSAFVIFRVVLPVLPPHPLSRRVAPKEFGLPNYKSLSPADKSHLWLAGVDIISLAFFVWQVIAEYLSGPQSIDTALNAGSAIRYWLILTLRQTCLLVIAGLILLHVRMGKSLSFGTKQWMVFAPLLLFMGVGMAISGVLSTTGVRSLFIGVTAYTLVSAILSTVAFGCLVGTLMNIRRNLSMNDNEEPEGAWPSELEEKPPRPSFATEDIDAMKDGSSWITSNASSHTRTVSAFSFSTVQTHHSNPAPQNPALGSHPSIPQKSSFWFTPATPHGGRQSPVPPVPPLPSPYRAATPADQDPDPFNAKPQAPRMGSQNSWLTEPSVSQATLSAWSFPATQPNSPASSRIDLETGLLNHGGESRPATPALTNARVLGGYGSSPVPMSLSGTEKGLASLSAPPVKGIEVSISRVLGWLVSIWFPLAFSLPFLIMHFPQLPGPSMPASIFLMLSITLSSPILACNILFKAPLPIPLGLFDSHPSTSPSTVIQGPSAFSLDILESEYKKSTSLSVTVVEGRRSGDVWISNGNAIDGKGKFSRAMGMLSPVPQLAVLPIESKEAEGGQLTPPLPMQEESLSHTTVSTPQSENSVELGRKRIDSMASSRYSADESMTFATRIMTAQRHYSALATTMVIPPSPKGTAAPAIAFTSATPARTTAHVRSRSASSVTKSVKSSTSTSRSPISPPPSEPLPPTPPRHILHQRSASSGFSFGPVDDMNEIDQLTAGLLPLLVPGLKIGSDMKIIDQTISSTSFSSPETHSTPANVQRKKGSHKKQHFSLPSLSLGRAVASTSSNATEDGYKRNSRVGVTTLPLRPVVEEDELSRSNNWLDKYAVKIGSSPHLSNFADVPTTARSSMATLSSPERLPTSAASTATLFSDSEPPLAESTPPSRHSHEALPHALTNDNPAPYTRRSSIVYIKSDENSAPNSRHSIRSSTVRPLFTKQHAEDPSEEAIDFSKPSHFRPDSILQAKDVNQPQVRTGGIRPLKLAKKQKDDRDLMSTPRRLARSATSKARGILRKMEVLPDVVVRPPSTGEELEETFSFR